jgi:hypothetical protein
MQTHSNEKSRYTPIRDESTSRLGTRSFGPVSTGDLSSVRASALGHRLSDYSAVSPDIKPKRANPISVSTNSQRTVSRDDLDPSQAPAAAPVSAPPPIWSPSSPGTIHAGPNWNISPAQSGPMGAPVPYAPEQAAQQRGQGDPSNPAPPSNTPTPGPTTAAPAPGPLAPTPLPPAMCPLPNMNGQCPATPQAATPYVPPSPGPLGSGPAFIPPSAAGGAAPAGAVPVAAPVDDPSQTS